MHAFGNLNAPCLETPNTFGMNFGKFPFLCEIDFIDFEGFVE